MTKSNFLRAFIDRGFLHQCTDIEALDSLLAKQKICGYIGFDCTADSLHVGSLIQIRILQLFQQYGHTPIILLGGATSKIGDPSEKDESRKLLTEEDIQRNFNGIKQVFDKFIDLDNAIMLNNDDWLGNINYIPFLRDYGRHFSVNRMLSFDSVKTRLEREQNLSFLEFNYMIFQAYDFLHLSREHDCMLQMGGSDQWSNILNGADLARRIDGKTIYGLTTPLLTTSSGKKMGKTEQGAVWLNDDKIAPYDYWQYWRNTEDADVIKFLKLFTDLPLDEIAKLGELGGSEVNEAKIILANEATKMLHGKTAANDAQQTATKVFEHGSAGGDLPSFEIQKSQLDAGFTLVEALKLCGFAKSNGEARRTITGRGARVNNETIDDEKALLSNEMIDASIGGIKISKGRKNHAILSVLS
jgi:tyrosyl-tRNA synthetase